MSDAITVSGYTPAQLRTIRQTVAGDTDETEFNLFMEACKSYRLDPFRKQIHAVVYGKKDPRKRKMSIIVSRDGLRVLAQRCSDYRPASEPAQITYDPDLKGPTNPKGIVSATVRLWKQDSRGEWYPVIGEADWDEFAPLRQIWRDNPSSGRREPTQDMELDSSGQWAKMPKVMITKCAESQALRAGWPDQFGNIYAEEEIEQATVSQTAMEEIQAFEADERKALVGGPGIMLVFDSVGQLEKVPTGQVMDRCMEFLRDCTPEEAHVFRVRNQPSLKDFWAHSKGDALELKRALEAKEAEFNPGAAA